MVQTQPKQKYEAHRGDEQSTDDVQKKHELDEQNRKKEFVDEEREVKKKAKKEEDQKAAKELKQSEELEKQDEDEERHQRDAKRQAVITKSKRLADELSEHDHAELGAIEAVQLIVAERISWLGAKLFGLDAPEFIEDSQLVGQQFDFLAALAEKFADPELETSDEVEAVYQQILGAIDRDVDTCAEQESAGIHVEEKNDELLRVLEHTFCDRHEEGQVLDSEEECTKHTEEEHDTAVALVIASLALACRHHSKHQHDGHSIPGLGGHDPGTLPTASAISRTSASTAGVDSRFTSSAASTQTASPRPLIVPSRPTSFGVVDTAASTLLIERALLRRDITTEHSVTPARATQVANLVEQDTFAPDPTPVHYAGERSSQTMPTTLQASRQQKVSTAAVYPLGQAFEHKDEMAHLSKSEISVEAEPNYFSAKPVEDWSLSDLLTSANVIPLGHGRYLKSAYESGEIDKAGLIKVIKDWKAGRSHKETFDTQRRRLTQQPINQTTEPVSSVNEPSESRAPISAEKPEQPPAAKNEVRSAISGAESEASKKSKDTLAPLITLAAVVAATIVMIVAVYLAL